MNRVFGILAFLLAFVTYTMTVQPSVPFWDCGEFSAASIWQQVPHPPGAPLFLMFGKLFHVLIPFGDPGWRVNMWSVFASAASIWFLYSTTVMVIKNFRKSPIETLGDAITVFGSAFIAAAAYTFSDTFWFNAVESEVYASSSLFLAVIVWLIMKWNEKADEVGNEKYLMLIAYIIGLSTGVHLLAILALFSIALIIYYRKYDFKWSSFFIMGAIAVVGFFIIYPGIVKMLPAFLAGHSAGRNAAQEYAMENSFLLKFVAIAGIALVAAGFWWGHKKGNQVIKLVTSCFLLVLLGYTTYTQILIRSNSNTPMNENEPKTFSKLASYLGREQYGDAPTWPRRYQTEDYFVQKYEEMDANGNYIYGKWYAPGTKEAQRKDGNAIGVPDFNKINTAGELTYMWKYQIDHMYLRYFFWNFVGRMSDVQDAEAAWFNVNKSELSELNYKSGYADQFPVRFFALPLLFGLIGMVFHYQKDKKMFLVYLVLFALTGVLATLSQNQQNPQPRERDYFYAGSFMVFSMWIGLGAYMLIEQLTKKKANTAIAGAIIAASFLLVPLNMAMGGWKIHSRAGDYIPFDYSYNILQSTEKDAILFTNGDNDTFPLWYLQDVMGIRRDVRIVNLSLANTLWYVDQLKNREPWGAKKLPLSFADDSLQVESETDPGALSYDFGEASALEIPVRREILAKYTNDPNILNEGKVKMTFIGKPYKEIEGKTVYIYRVQDKVIRDILVQTKFERPIYFSNTVGPDVYCGLDNFFRLEGMAFRVCPIPPKRGSVEPINESVMEKCLMNQDNSNDFHTEPNYGFKFRNLNNVGVYYDEVHRRLMNSYRLMFLTYAEYQMKEKHNRKKAIEVLNKMNETVSPVQFPLSFEMEAKIARMYDDANDKARTNEWADKSIKSCEELIANPALAPMYVQYELAGRYLGPNRVLAEMFILKNDYKAARNALERLLKATEAFLNQNGGDQAEGRNIMMAILDIRASIDELLITEQTRKGNNERALQIAKELMAKYQASQDNTAKYSVQMLARKIGELETKMGIKKPADSLTTDSVVAVQ